MTLGHSAAVVNEFLDRTLADVYIQLHTGEPGPVGAAHVATNDMRQPISFVRAEAGVSVSDVEARWDEVPAVETYTHFSLWDSPQFGTFVGSGELTPTPVNPALVFMLEPGAVVDQQTVAS